MSDLTDTKKFCKIVNHQILYTLWAKGGRSEVVLDPQIDVMTVKSQRGILRVKRLFSLDVKLKDFWSATQ